MIKRTLFFLFLIGMYVLVVNVLAMIPEIQMGENNSLIISSSGMAKADFGHSVKVTVERDRFCLRTICMGHIIEEGGISNLYVLKFIKIPLKSEIIDFRTSNKVFFGIISIFYLIVFISVTRNKRIARRWKHERNLQASFDYTSYS